MFKADKYWLVINLVPLCVFACVWLQEEPARRPAESPGHHVALSGGRGAGSVGHVLPGGTDL